MPCMLLSHNVNKYIMRNNTTKAGNLMKNCNLYQDLRKTQLLIPEDE
jgi:hypothetical protein